MMKEVEDKVEDLSLTTKRPVYRPLVSADKLVRSSDVDFYAAYVKGMHADATFRSSVNWEGFSRDRVLEFRFVLPADRERLLSSEGLLLDVSREFMCAGLGIPLVGSGEQYRFLVADVHCLGVRSTSESELSVQLSSRCLGEPTTELLSEAAVSSTDMKGVEWHSLLRVPRCEGAVSLSKCGFLDKKWGMSLLESLLESHLKLDSKMLEVCEKGELFPDHVTYALCETDMPTLHEYDLLMARGATGVVCLTSVEPGMRTSDRWSMSQKKLYEKFNDVMERKRDGHRYTLLSMRDMTYEAMCLETDKVVQNYKRMFLNVDRCQLRIKSVDRVLPVEKDVQVRVSLRVRGFVFDNRYFNKQLGRD